MLCLLDSCLLTEAEATALTECVRRAKGNLGPSESSVVIWSQKFFLQRGCRCWSLFDVCGRCFVIVLMDCFRFLVFMCFYGVLRLCCFCIIFVSEIVWLFSFCLIVSFCGQLVRERERLIHSSQHGYESSTCICRLYIYTHIYMYSIV